MFLNNNKYKEFYFGSLISEIYKAKAINKDDLDVANNKSTSINYITRTGENNWCEMLADITWISENYIEKWNAITIWDTTATCFYQEKQFIAWDHMVVIRADWLNKYTWLYIVTLLNKEQYKYSYGRAFVKDKIKNTILKLPVDEFWNPNRKFMEKYMKTLHYKPITTKNKAWKNNLNINKWREFRVGDLFIIWWSKTTPKEILEDIWGWIYPYITTSSTNNWVDWFYNYYTENWDIIAVESACMWFSTYQSEKFSASDHVEVLKPKYYFNKYIWLFIVTLINNQNFRYSYWRKCNQTKINNMTIKLPIDKNWNPDREFMEYYIKNLPYWDRI